jgi:hypothetical protein
MSEPTAKRLSWLLSLNLIAMIVVAVVLLSRGATPGMPAAFAQMPQPIAGGAGLFLMPAQFAQSRYGCYVMDVDRQTLIAYEYFPGDRMLRLAAARDFSFDRELRNFNTQPSPAEVQDMLTRERDRARIVLPPVPALEPAQPN